MGRGSSKMSGGGGGGVTNAQTRMLAQIANKTRNLKNEQYRIIDENGNVVLLSKGKRHEVGVKVGDKRDNLPGAVSIHNHPDGGTFSDADLSEFGYGARAMAVASPEGTYILTNNKYGKKDQASGWLDMRNEMERQGITRERGFTEIRKEARNSPNLKRREAEMVRLSDQWVKKRESGAPTKELDSLSKKYEKKSEEYKQMLKDEERKIVTKPYHDFYKKNAKKYGFTYTFTPKK